MVLPSSEGMGSKNGLSLGSSITWIPGPNLCTYSKVIRSGLPRNAAASSGGLTNALGVAFGPDGNLYVGSWGEDTVKRYNKTTGTYIDDYVTTGLGGLLDTFYFNFIPEQQVLVLP